MRNAINWKIFFILLSLSLISIACVFPYVISVQSEVLRQVKIPLAILFAAQFIQSSILFAVLVYFGLLLTKKTQFQLPLLEAIIDRKNYKPILRNILGISILSGILVAIAIYALDGLFSLMGVSISTHQNYAPVWQKLLAAVYGGITE